ncbi:MAG: glycosyltransferase family 39 protein [Lachnospiraceae bacterium]|nr:glycosyltransferase family 39 protein [Lachnospiraceae bacterium]
MFTAFALTGLAISLIVIFLCVRKKKAGNTSSGGFLTVIGSFIEKYHIIFLFLIFAVFLISRLLKLETFPSGFHVDELSMAVDAKSILNSGTDRGGIRYPAYFQNYGGGQNALYIYIQAFILSFMKPTIFAFRVQAVFWGAVCFFMMYAICYELTNNRGWALAGPVLVTVLPVYIMSERWGLEAYLFLPFSSIVMYLAIRAVKYEKAYYWILTGVFLGASLYTYAVSYVAWPVFLVLTLAYLLYLKKIRISQVVEFIIPLIILAFPLILFQLVNFKIIPPFSLGISDYFPLPIEREHEMGLTNMWDSLKFTGKLLLGGEALTYNSVREFGTIYLFLIPFLIIGFVICIKKTIESIKNRTFTCHALILFFWFGSTVFMLLVKGPSVNRLNMIFMPFLLFIVIGIHDLVSDSAAGVSALIVWTGASFVFFMYFYFFMMNDMYARHELFTNSSFAKAIVLSEKYYMKDENTHIYVQFENEAIEPRQQTFYFAGGRDAVYSDDEATYGRVTAGLPEEIDVNENAVYIIGDQWPHITSYLISQGFLADQRFPGCSILVKLQ